MDGLLVVKLVEDAIAADDNEVKLVLRGDLEGSDVRLSYHHFRVSIEFLEFCLDVSEGPGD